MTKNETLENLQNIRKRFLDFMENEGLLKESFHNFQVLIY